MIIYDEAGRKNIFEKPFCLSDKEQCLGFHDEWYNEQDPIYLYEDKDVKKFIKKLKVELQNRGFAYFESTKEGSKEANKEIREIIDKLAGSKLTDDCQESTGHDDSMSKGVYNSETKGSLESSYKPETLPDSFSIKEDNWKMSICEVCGRDNKDGRAGFDYCGCLESNKDFEDYEGDIEWWKLKTRKGKFLLK